jgi:predicted AAA+ superfamily ATPase
LRSLSFLFPISSFLAAASNERAGKKEKKAGKADCVVVALPRRRNPHFQAIKFKENLMNKNHEQDISTNQKGKTGILKDVSIAGLASWRDIIQPHPDVAEGRYKNAEFAADLAQVARGQASFEYLDPAEFFARTYITEGMRGLLEQALRRVCGKDGDPVIQLKTAFGGGKTHSLLALYHMLRGRISLDKIPNLAPVLQKAGISKPPKVHAAVIVGTALDPTKSRRPQNIPGITVNTIWGEIAAQLAESAANPKLYDYVKEADKKGVSPGSIALATLFDAAGPCLILLDELAAYAKKIYGVHDLPAGTFDNLITFVQEITEAAKASKNSLVVASIPESDIEIGGAAGKKIIESIEHTFGRMECIWKPVAASEGFEVVRRRLFHDCKDENGRDAVCVQFAQMYRDNPKDFPIETREGAYLERMKSCYPIHPEVFDRLYEDWATLERFQRTRGVLRLMASVIYELWMGDDASLMIMPSTIPLCMPNVRDELTRHLPDTWNAIVDREVDGRNSIPFQTDKNTPRYGDKLAARRIARTIMLGSAPSVGGQRIRGIEAARIRLGTVQPGENISDFNDALNVLAQNLSYLYADQSSAHFWYDTRPTLRKTAQDRAVRISDFDAEYEIEGRLKRLRKEPPFSGVHICPSSSLDIADEQSARLIVLRPADGYKGSDPNNKALKMISETLNNRGEAARIYRNMLVFIAPDQGLMEGLKTAVKAYLAWKSIDDDKESLNLDANQNHEADKNIKQNNETVDRQIKETYRWIFVPLADSDRKTILWNIDNISGGDDGIIAKAAKKMRQDEAVIAEMHPRRLVMELENLWKDSSDICIKELWRCMSSYCYMPRLTDENVLKKAILEGVKSGEFFAFAAGFDGNRYIDLELKQMLADVDFSGYLVKLEAAKKQIADDEKDKPPQTPLPKPTGETPTNGVAEPIEPQNKHFHMSAELDAIRIGRDVQRLLEEVINHLISTEGANVEISLEVNAQSTNGFSKETTRTISESCKALNVKVFEFE